MTPQPRDNLIAWLRDAYAMEGQAIELLEQQIERLEHYLEMAGVMKVAANLQGTTSPNRGFAHPFLVARLRCLPKLAVGLRGVESMSALRRVFGRCPAVAGCTCACRLRSARPIPAPRPHRASCPNEEDCAG
jgi:hypothetical protein